MNNIVFLEQTYNYPKSYSASNTKVEFIAKGLLEQGNKVTTLNSFILGTKSISKIEKGVTDFGFEYYMFPRISATNLIRNIRYTIKLLKSKKVRNGKNVAFVAMDFFPLMLLSIFIAKLSGYKVVSLFHEWHVTFKAKGFLYRLNYYLSDYIGCYFLNGIFPISHFLEKKSMKFHKPMMILPILADYKLERKSAYNGSDNFTFCGHASYLLRYNLILNAFKKVHSINETCTLTLVTFGYDWQLEKLKQEIKDLGLSDSVIIKSQLSTAKLNEIYDESLALLIPLELESDRDKARFSQKIAEYTASGRPIITTPVGEIPYYFTSDKNALICDYNENSFSNVMLNLLSDKEHASQIGAEGKLKGFEFFDYRINGEKLNSFINDRL